MLVAIVGKPNSGKTTFFSAATLVDAEISSRVFTTIKPNRGVSFVRVKCVCKDLGVTCNPRNSQCIDGERLIPVTLIDIAGLVPGAHEGHGLGNKFLSEIMEASVLVHVVDMSGGTDSEGNITSPGSHEPSKDIAFLEKEIEWWMFGILNKEWGETKRKLQASKGKPEDAIASKLSGLRISRDDVAESMKATGAGLDSSESERLEFISDLRKRSKPITIAGNKIDVPEAQKNMGNIECVPCSAESELALRKAAEAGIIKYIPGDSDFEIIKELEEKQKKALHFIKENVLKKFSSTGVQKAINSAIFDMLKMIVVYPVENENRFSDKNGNVLPDALLVKRGTTARQLAGKIHTDLEYKFLAAIDARTKKNMAADHELNNGDVVKIVLRK